MNIRSLKIVCRQYPTFAGLKIAVAADFHAKKRRNERKIRRELAQMAACGPDIICVPGDVMLQTGEYSVWESFNQNGFFFLAECRKIAPVYYSLGNHERGMTDENRAALADAGITLLDNAWVRDRSHTLVIGGLSSGYGSDTICGTHRKQQTPPPDLAFLREFAAQDGFRLLLCHHPEYWPEYIRETGIELTLSGHAHGGQWQIPFTNRGVFAPGQGLFPKYTSGVYENRLAVSRGMSNTVAVPRFFNPCEVLLIELVAK